MYTIKSVRAKEDFVLSATFINGIVKDDDLDLDSNDIWEDGIEVGKKEIGVVDMVASGLMKARNIAGMTQKQLSEVTGIYQADISKIERGLSNPSVLTLKRLAEGMGVKLRIEFEFKDF